MSFETDSKTYIEPDQRISLVRAIQQLCEPDPKRRGYPTLRAGGVEPTNEVRPYVSVFNALREKTAYNFRKANAG